jgi:hypothetical protein
VPYLSFVQPRPGVRVTPKPDSPIAVFVLHGTSDTFAPVAHAGYTRRIVPGASLDTREGLGHFSISLPSFLLCASCSRGERLAPHMWPEERPTELTALVNRFLESHVSWSRRGYRGP